MEKLIVESPVGEDLVEMVAVGVGNEDLTELPTGHQMDDLLDTRGIELVEDIVEQQQRQALGRTVGCEKLVLG